VTYVSGDADLPVSQHRLGVHVHEVGDHAAGVSKIPPLLDLVCVGVLRGRVAILLLHDIRLSM